MLDKYYTHLFHYLNSISLLSFLLRNLEREKILVLLYRVAQLHINLVLLRKGNHANSSLHLSVVWNLAATLKSICHYGY